MKTSRILATTVAALLGFASPLHAAFRYWIDPAGGLFGDIGNWSTLSNGAGGASVPGAADIAVFTVAGTYTVTFTSAVTMERLWSDEGDATLDLGGFSHVLTDPNSTIGVAVQPLLTSRLTVRNGTIGMNAAVYSVYVGQRATSPGGFLTVTTGGTVGTTSARPNWFVGGPANGTLTVNSTGRINAAEFTMGDEVGITGVATITGTGAVANISGTAYIGDLGTGSLSVLSGGDLVTSQGVYLGFAGGSNGTATVSGSGSTWSGANGMVVGNSGNGTLSVLSGGTLSMVGGVILGNAAAITGNATVSGAGSAWTGVTSIVVGNAGDSTLTVSAGGVVSTGIASLGSQTGSLGTVTVTGVGSQWNVSSGLTLGNSGQGVMTISAGGAVTATSTTILGSTAGSDGRLTVTGTGSQLTANGGSGLFVGSFGSGNLSVASGGDISTLSLTIGNAAGGNGVATVAGNGSSLTSTLGVTVGNVGIGSLSVTGGGTVSSQNITLGGFAGASGTATVSGIGSSWTSSAAATIGSGGDGNVTVSNGGTLATGAATLGSAGTGNGILTVTGTGSQMNMTGILAIGSGSQGTMTVSSGGTVDTTGLLLGSASTGNGTLTLIGTGSRLTSTGAVSIASLGNGTLNVSSGGELHAGSTFTIGDPAGAPVGTLNLNGGSVFVSGNFSNSGVLNHTNGLLQVAGNYQANGVPAALGINGNGTTDLPVLDLIGPGTTTNVTLLRVGLTQRGQLLLRGGRVLDTGANSVSIGESQGSEGTIGVQSGAQLTTAGTLAVGGSGNVAGGTGTLDVAGGTVDANALRLFAGGTVNLSSGTLSVNSTPVLDGQFNWTGGTLRLNAFTSLSGTNVPKLLGSAGTLQAGQTLASSAGVGVNVDTPILVDGGALNVSTLTNNSTLEIRTGSANVSVNATNSAGAQLFLARDLSVAGTLTNASGGRITLTGGTGRITGAGVLTNSGLITGDGTVVKPLTNATGGEIRAENAKTLLITGVNGTNVGRVNMQGGTIEFSQAFTNGAAGIIQGRGVANFAGGITNQGAMNFSAGTTDVFGNVNMTGGTGGSARVISSGGGTVTFYNGFIHNGAEVRASTGSRVVLFGAVTGSGPFTGAGTVSLEGSYNPGGSPALVTIEPNFVYNGGSLQIMEIFGAQPGANNPGPLDGHDKLVFTSPVGVQVQWGGTLEIDLGNDFHPLAGMTFDLFDFDNTRDAGTFSKITVNDPNALLAPGLTFDYSRLYMDGTVTVAAPTPEPTSALMLAIGGMFLSLRRLRRAGQKM